MSSRGKYIVLEGPEGVGKSTQIQELGRRLQLANLPVRILREPDSQSDLTARALRQLTQDPRYPMNTRTEVLLYNAARSQSLQVIKESVEQGIICIVDRNYLTTLAVQYYGRGDVPDYDTINNIINFAVDGVEPDLCIVLDAPAQVLKARSVSRDSGERFDNLDEAFLERIRAGYLWEAQQRKFPIVYATDSVDDIANNIWKLVSQTLAIRTPAKATTISEPLSVKEILKGKEPEVAKEAPVEKLDEQELIKKNQKGIYEITEAGRDYLSTVVTNSTDDVYAFNETLSPVTIAASMARLSRRGDDMRITLLDEFVGAKGKDANLLKRVITAYGDDSVQQLSGLHFVVENASNLLTKKLEWGRLAAYLEQSTRYIYYDQKDVKGHYKYYVPTNLKPSVKKQYKQIVDQIFDNYSAMVRKLTEHVRAASNVVEAERDVAWQGATRAQACDAIRPVLPVATKSTVGIYASGQALESLIYHLQSDELAEARTTGENLLNEARKIVPMFLERTDKPERGGAFVAYRATNASKVKKLADKYLSTSYADDKQQPITLTDYYPKNELDLVPDMLYSQSSLSLGEIRSEVDKLTYNQKLSIFNSYIGERLNRRHRPGRALEKAHYSWDLVCDYGIFRDLQRHRMVDDLEWQNLSPRYGYEVPKLVEEANLEDKFEECFDLSLKLYSLLQEAGYETEAQYATLLGHRMRWKVTYNAREAMHLHEIRTSPQGHPGYRKLVKEMHDKLAEVHPLLAESMKFVNKDEDPELTRLAAERYTQFKLKQLK
ncbi:MAG TPA: dTMP kinase [Candidatus Saccharimonadales bacterium]